MSSVSKKLRQAYYDLLNGISVEVYKEDVPKSESSHHVVIRVEGETDDSNRKGFINNPVVITEVVGVFSNSVNPDVVDDIDNEIHGRLLPTNGAIEISASGIGINLIRCLNSEYINEYDGTKRYYRKITRWQQRVSQD
jgi:hypothetical protein